VTGRLSRRRWLAGAGVAMWGGLGAASARGQTRVEPRPVAGVRGVLWQAAGELLIEQTGRERLSVEAEPALLPRILTEVRDGRLSIRFAPGRIETRHPIRIRLEVESLASIEAEGAGTLHVGALTVPALTLRLAGSETLALARLAAERLDVRLDGSGGVVVGGGQVERQQIVITGSADYDAPRLACRSARVSIEGSGNVRLAVAERLEATIDGSGEVLYLGQPRVAKRMGGSGGVRQVSVK
jgi:Putative auto-transporter adhesin, head GIN domain